MPSDAVIAVRVLVARSVLLLGLSAALVVPCAWGQGQRISIGRGSIGFQTQTPDTASASTTPLLLTPELLTQVGNCLAALHQHPELMQRLAHDTIHRVRFPIQYATFPIVGSDTMATDTAVVLDYGAVAAMDPAIHAAFTRAGLDPVRYLPFVKALTFAAATDTLQLALEGSQDGAVVVDDTTTTMWRNVEFFRAHRAAIAALGIAIPKFTAWAQGNPYLAFLDTTPRPHIRALAGVNATDTAEFPIGYLDSTEAPGAVGAHRLPPLRVLFVGNSLTYYNEMPRMFSRMAAPALHRRVVVGLVSIPAATLFELWEMTDLRQVIAHLPWDYIVVQCRPQASRLREAFTQYATVFAQAAARRHAQVAVWTEYGAANGEPGMFDPDLMAAAAAAHARFIPVAAAWGAVKQRDIELHSELINGDGHPSVFGSYLIALLTYHVLTGHSPVGLPAAVGRDTIPAADALRLQRIAETVR